ncbi:MAG: aminopeptidase P family protein [Acidobacteria bacterium]|nr:aminopeptidase P family protein [Acidobacteriota bacterium]
MLSRRSLITSGALAAGALATTRTVDAGQAPTAPASIASLTSMRGQAVPIRGDERRGRVEKARRLMGEHEVDALMLTGGTSLVYFSGIQWGLSERLFSLVIPRSGEPFVVCPAFEEDRAREQFATSPFTGTADVRTWEEHDSPYERLAQGLKDRGISTGRIGVEETVRHMFVDGVAKAAPALTLVSGTPVTAGCRTIKDQHELTLMKLACAVTLTAYEAAWKALAEGMTQNAFQGLIAAAHAKLGYPGYASVQTAEFSALPHGSIQPQVIREGTIILIDGGCAVEGYQSDISRTFVLGRATDKMKKVFDLEFAAQTAALEAARPGVPCEAVDAAARKVIEDGGYGPGYKYFTHRVGHGMGMDGHEWPYLVKGNRLPLAPGMVFSDEPGIYIRGEFGVRLEDDMYITESGAELMTPQSRSLERPFATS